MILVNKSEKLVRIVWNDRIHSEFLHMFNDFRPHSVIPSWRLSLILCRVTMYLHPNAYPFGLMGVWSFIGKRSARKDVMVKCILASFCISQAIYIRFSVSSTYGWIFLFLFLTHPHWIESIFVSVWIMIHKCIYFIALN